MPRVLRTVPSRAVAAAAVACILVASGGASAVPSFARQTKMACNACHVQFPVLNEFGREFKLTGYTLIDRPTIKEKDDSGREILDLPLPQLLSVMFETDFTNTDKGEPGLENNNVEFPDQASLFLAGRLAPMLGSFLQVTYSGADDKFGFDNTDIRFAHSATVADHEVAFGASFNNNPGVTDLWNSSPAWGYPYAFSPSAPTPAASPLIEGGLAQEVAGLNGFALIDGLVYTEAGVYASAPLGVSRPLAPTGSLNGAVPYWRVALQKQWGRNYLMLGHFGLFASVDPGGGATASRFTDLAADFQYQRSFGSDAFQLQGRWIYERSSFDAGSGVASNGHDHLHEVRLDATYYRGQHVSFTLAPFFTFGSSDPLLYPPGSVGGSATGDPDSSGLTAQVSYNPWMNIRLTAQYTAYFEFNGRSNNYDGSGRDASDNNTLFLQLWGAW